MTARRCIFGLLAGGWLLLQVAPGHAQSMTEKQAIALVQQADNLLKAGEYSAAERLYRRVLAEAPRLWGDGSTNQALLLYALAALYKDMGRYKQAEPLFLRSLAIREARLGKEHPLVASSLNNLAGLYVVMGRYSQAQPLYQRSLAISEAKLGKEHPHVAGTLNNLAILYKNMGRYEQAEPLFQRSLAIFEAKPGKDHLLVADTLSNLAGLYHDMGRYEQAEPLHRRSLQIREAQLGRDHPDVAASLNNLASLYKDTSRYEQAEPLLQRSLVIREAKLGRDHPLVAQTLHNLADLYHDMGRDEQAEPLHRRSLAIREAKLGKDHPDVGKSLSNLANVYKAMGRYEQAEPLYRRSLAIREAQLGEDHHDVAASLNNLAILYVDTGRYELAEPLYRRSLRIHEAKLGKDHPDLAISFNNLANLYMARDQAKAAADHYEQSRRIVRRHAGRVLPLLAEREQLDFFHRKDEARLHAALTLGYRHAAEADFAARSAGWLLNAKGLAQQTQAQGILAARDSRDPQSGEALRQLLDIRRQLARLSLTRPTAQDEAHGRQRQELSQREQELIKQLQRQGTAVEDTESWIELPKLRAALPANAVFVDIARFPALKSKATGQQKRWWPAHYVAWLTPKDGAVRVLDLGEADKIDTAVHQVRQALDAAPRRLKADGEIVAEKAARQALDELAHLVLQPLRPHLDGVSRWLICPDGNLWLVPWAALPLDDKTYAVEKHTLQLVVSGRDLVSPPRGDTLATAVPAVFADPDFDHIAANLTRLPVPEGGLTRGLAQLKLGKVPRLPGTAAEAQAVAQRLDKLFGRTAQVWTEDKATTSAFLALRRPQALVLATHGFFLPDQKDSAAERERLARDPQAKQHQQQEDPLLRCGLLLAGCNRLSEGGDTGVLTGREVLSADLRGCQMVVLSACETGLGDVRNGEGVAGLRQAFQLAGAASVLASLWQIPDRDTALLMVALMDGLGQGQDRALALAQAQRQRIRARRERSGAAHPFFWAAFTLTGGAGQGQR
jgi:CHAT domain-containing protein